MVIFGLVIIQKKSNLWDRYWINQDSWFTSGWDDVMTCHDVMFAELGWCPQISNILWLPSVDIRMLRDHFKTWAPEDSEAFAPWFFGRIWPLLNPWNRWNLWVQWWMDLQSRHKVEKKKVHDVAFNGKHLFVIPTSQLKTATHIFRNLNRWKIDRKGHDLDLARQWAAGCGCCWSLGRCTTGQPGGGWGIYLAFFWCFSDKGCWVDCAVLLGA